MYNLTNVLGLPLTNVALPSEKKVDTFMCCDIFNIIIAKLWRNFNSQVY